MCIISGNIKSVKSTKILAIPSRCGNKQLTVYSNTVATDNNNVMCLPVPNPNTINFETVPKDIFNQCKDSFDKISFRSSNNIVAAAAINKIREFSHGSYDVIVIPSINFLDEIPPSFAELTPDVIIFLKRHYENYNFGFILCKLKTGSINYEPFAYSHNMHQNGKLFFPTKHYHKQTKQEPNYGAWANSFGTGLLGNKIYDRTDDLLDVSIPNGKYADDWDHELYSLKTSKNNHISKTKNLLSYNKINWSNMPENFRIGQDNTLHCMEIFGEKENIDIMMFLE